MKSVSPSSHPLVITEEISRERQRLIARQALREQKLEESYEDWLRQLRDRAYVEYRLDDINRP